MNTELTLDIFIHLEAVDRNAWEGPGDERPLTDLGKRQSEAMARLLLADGPVQALLSSPARRCRETLAPLAATTGLPVEVLPGFRDTLGYRAPAGWENPERPGPDPLGGAYSAGAAFAAFESVRRRQSLERAVLCSYGDIVPAFIAFLAGRHGVDVPPRSNARGYLYRLRFAGESLSMEARPAPSDFPA
jgi:8-oxo-dGTP diphosphatase